MQLARYQDRDRIGWGSVHGDEFRVLTDEDYSIEQLIGDPPAALTKRAVDASRVLNTTDVHLLPPVSRPSKVIGVGLNYRSHAAETNLTVHKEPLIFAKFPSSIIGSGQAILIPPESQQVDWEAELAIVIGRRARLVPESQALDYVAGYTVANDVTARDIQIADDQWVRAKSFDTFCPLGPWITTVDELGSAGDLNVSLRVGDRLMQDSRTSNMVFGVRQLVAFCSSVATLEAGDLILTGTPEGTGDGMRPQVFLRPGDEVAASIEGIGTLTNPVRASPDRSDPR